MKTRQVIQHESHARMAVVAAIQYLEGRDEAREWHSDWLPRFRELLDEMNRLKFGVDDGQDH